MRKRLYYFDGIFGVIFLLLPVVAFFLTDDMGTVLKCSLAAIVGARLLAEFRKKHREYKNNEVKQNDNETAQ